MDLEDREGIICREVYTISLPLLPVLFSSLPTVSMARGPRIDLCKYTRIISSTNPLLNYCTIFQTSELIELLESLQHSAASADAATRRAIAQFPPEVSDSSKAMDLLEDG